MVELVAISSMVFVSTGIDRAKLTGYEKRIKEWIISRNLLK